MRTSRPSIVHTMLLPSPEQSDGILGRPAAARAALLSRTHGVSHALIVADGQPVGYMCWEPPPKRDLEAAGLVDLPDRLTDIDIMIGEPEALGRGFGPEALALLLERLRTDPRVDWAGLATSLANERAIRAYEKAGFRRFREFLDPEIGPALYLVVDLRPGGKGAKT